MNATIRPKHRRHWADWHEVNPWLFPTIAELAQDRGAVGHFLSMIPAEVRRDADRCPEPWQALANVPLLTQEQRELCAACNSVLPAALKLVGKLGSHARLEKQARLAQTEAEIETANARWFAAIYPWDPGLKNEAAREGEEMLRQFQANEADFRLNIAKHKGKDVATAFSPSKPSADPVRLNWPLEYLMVSNWLRCGIDGDPGFAFYSAEALTTLFTLFDWTGFGVCGDNLETEAVERMRERLGLRLAIPKIPYVTGARFDPGTGTVIELNWLDAKQAVGDYQWPPDPLRLRARIQLSQTVLYPGLPG